MIFLFHTRWKDICVFTFGESNYVLQGRKNKITGASKFRIGDPNGFSNCPRIRILNEEILEQANMWDKCEESK